MAETIAPVPDQAGAPADSGIVSVQTRPAKTLPGLVGVLLALVGLGLIVEGAVGMVEDALELLAERSVVELDQDAKASLVANLLVVLTSEQQTTPVVNTGSGR